MVLNQEWNIDEIKPAPVLSRSVALSKTRWQAAETKAWSKLETGITKKIE